MASALTSMLEAQSVALVGASPRPGSFGQRMIEEVTSSPSRPRVYLVNPRYPEIGGQPCHPSLAELPEPVDLVLLGVRDDALEDQLSVAASRGDRAAVIFGNAHSEPDPLAPGPSLRDRLGRIAREAGMALCGAGCMGFINVSRGLRAMGYTEASSPRPGPVALVTHSGSVFSALLRTRRALGVLAGGVLRPGAGHHHPGLPGVRAGPPRDPGCRAGPGGHAGRGTAARRAGHGRRAGHPGRAADRGRIGGRPGDGGRALGRPGRR